jgi:hypothetical protein
MEERMYFEDNSRRNVNVPRKMKGINYILTAFYEISTIIPRRHFDVQSVSYRCGQSLRGISSHYKHEKSSH